MTDFFVSPRLPEREVTAVVVSTQNPDVIESLQNRGITVFPTCPCPDLSNALSRHADLVFAPLGGNRCIIEKSQLFLAKLLVQSGFEIVEQVTLDPVYPKDCLLNNLILSDFLFHGKKTPLLPSFLDLELQRIPLNQGYTACNSIILNENVILTSDRSIHSTAVSLGIDSVFVPAGEILLKDYNAGFLGGCAGLLSPSLLAFSGAISKLSSFPHIKTMCEKNAIKILELSDAPVEDIGGIIPIF